MASESEKSDSEIEQTDSGMNLNVGIKNYILTDYPSIYGRTYWGGSTASQSKLIIDNRNKFIKEYKIIKVARSNYKIDLNFKRIGGHKNSIYDHVEFYSVKKEEDEKPHLILIMSPYSVSDNDHQFLTKIGWAKIYPLYGNGAVTYIYYLYPNFLDNPYFSFLHESCSDKVFRHKDKEPTNVKDYLPNKDPPCDYHLMYNLFYPPNDFKTLDEFKQYIKKHLVCIAGEYKTRKNYKKFYKWKKISTNQLYKKLANMVIKHGDDNTGMIVLMNIIEEIYYGSEEIIFDDEDLLPESNLEE